MGNYFRTVSAAAREALSSMGTIASATKQAVGEKKEAIVEKTEVFVEKANRAADNANGRLAGHGIGHTAAEEIARAEGKVAPAQVTADPVAALGAATTIDPATADKHYAYCYALIAISKYIAGCDGNFDEDEVALIRRDLRAINNNTDVPQEVKEQINVIANTDMTFEQVTKFLDMIGIRALEALSADVDTLIKADGVVTPEEEAVRTQFREYIANRKAAQ